MWPRKTIWNDGLPLENWLIPDDAPAVACRNICFGGSKGGGGGGTTTQQSTTTIPPEVLARYNAVNARAETAAGAPFTPYGGEFVSPVNATQQGGIGNITGAAGTATPYYGAATNALNNGLAGAQPYFGTATGQVASGLAGGTAGNASATGALNSGLAGTQPYNASAGQNYAGAYAGAQPYNGAATGLALAGTQAVDPGALNIGQYMSPYTQSVINSTLGYTDQQQAQQRQGLTSNAILSGSYGGDRSGIAQDVLQGQQNLARSNIVSGLYNQNYQQALAAGQQQQGVGLGAGQANRAALQGGANQLLGIGSQGYSQGMGLGSAQQGLGSQVFNQGLGASQQYGNIGQMGYSQGLGAAQANLGIGGQRFSQGNTAAGTNAGLGTGLLGAQLQQGQAQLGAGTVQQQTGQAQDTATYNQFLQQQGYPFQVAQFLANIAEGTGALSGSSTTGSTTAPQPFFSDERLKENIHTIGHTKDGLKIIRFNYKNSPHTQIGLSAQDVEKTKPDAVGLAGGYKTVDYDRATRALGGAVANDNAGQGFAGGGLAYDPSTLSALLMAHQAMYPNAAGAGHIGTGTPGAAGIVPASSGSAPKTLQGSPLMKLPDAQPSGLRQAMSGVNDVTGAVKTGKSLYSGAKDALVGEAAQGKDPATGGLLGTGGKWDPDKGWVGKQTGSGAASTAPAASSGTVSSTPLAPIDATTGAPVDIAAAMPADASLIDDAIGIVARRGGRIQRAAGGGMPFADYSILPEDTFDPIDPNKLKNEQAGLENKLPGGSGGGGGHAGGGGGSGGLGGTIGSLAGMGLGSFGGPMGMMAGSALGGTLGRMFKNGGRTGFDEGGLVASEPPIMDPDALETRRVKAGLVPVPDNVVPFKRDPEDIARRPSSMPPHGPSNGLVPALNAAGLGEERALQPNDPADVRAAALREPPVAAPAATSSVGLVPGAPAPPLPAPTSVRSDDYNTSEKVAARHWNQESGDRQYNPDGTLVTSSVGAVGRSQLYNAGPDAAKLAGVPWDPTRAKNDEGYNRLLGNTWLKHLNDQYGDPYKAVAAYNAGSGAVDKAVQTSQARGGNYWDYLPAETQNHLYAISGGQYGKQSSPPAGLGGGTSTASNGPPPPTGGTSPGDPATAGLAGGAYAAPSALGVKDVQKGDWLDRNERPIVAGLTFLGNMLGSKSHQLLGSIGEGIAAAAPAYASMGFKQQEAGLTQQGQAIQSRSLDIQQRAQYMTLLTQLRTMQNAKTSRGEPPDPQLAAQITHLAGLVAAPSNGPNGGATPSGGLPPGPLAGQPSAPPAAPAGAPVAPPVQPATGPGNVAQPPATPPQGPLGANTPSPAPAITPAMAEAHPALRDMPAAAMDPAYLKTLHQDENFAELYQRADQMVAQGDPTGQAKELVARADRAAANMKDRGWALDPNGNAVRMPGWAETQRGNQFMADNTKWSQAEGANNDDRQKTRVSLNLVKEALEQFKTNPNAHITSEIQQQLRFVFPSLNLGDSPQWNASAVAEIAKQAANRAGTAGNTDLAHSLAQVASVEGTKPPEANKKILAQAFGDVDRADARFDYLNPNLSRVPYADRTELDRIWSRAHDAPSFYDKAYQELAVRGATPPQDEMKPKHIYIIEPGDEKKYNIGTKLTGPTKFRVTEKDGKYILVETR